MYIDDAHLDAFDKYKVLFKGPLTVPPGDSKKYDGLLPRPLPLHTRACGIAYCLPPFPPDTTTTTTRSGGCRCLFRHHIRLDLSLSLRGAGALCCPDTRAQ